MKSKKCGRDDSFPCSTITRGGESEKNFAGYLVRCETCHKAGRLSTHAGETGRNGFSKGKEHLDALRLEDEENLL